MYVRMYMHIHSANAHTIYVLPDAISYIYNISFILYECYAYIYIYISVCVYTYADNMQINTYVCIYTYIYIYMYIYKYIYHIPFIIMYQTPCVLPC